MDSLYRTQVKVIASLHSVTKYKNSISIVTVNCEMSDMGFVVEKDEVRILSKSVWEISHAGCSYCVSKRYRSREKAIMANMRSHNVIYHHVPATERGTMLS